MRRLSYLAVKAAVSVGVRPDRSGIKLTGKRGKCASRGPTRTQRREPLEETKRQIDHMLLAGLTSPSLEAVLGHISREHNAFKRRQHVANLHSVPMNGTERLRAPERVTGERVSAQPLNPLGQFFCALLDICKERVVVDGEGSFFGGSIIVRRTRNSLFKPCRGGSV